jgi:hypothetical protein
MIALRLTYNGNADWVYPFPLSFLHSCHSLGGRNCQDLWIKIV